MKGSCPKCDEELELIFNDCTAVAGVDAIGAPIINCPQCDFYKVIREVE